MITFPCAKINLGLNIVSRRQDGYHNLQTVFWPIRLCDALEIKTMHEAFPSAAPCDLKVTGNDVACNEEENLVTRAYRMLAADHKLPRVHAHLFKNIPSQAGLGGGSSDASYMIRLLDNRFRLNLGNAVMESYAARLGADCAFFISAEPAYAEGIGEVLSPVNVHESMFDSTIVVVKPAVAISTREAFSMITPMFPERCCRDIVALPVTEWRQAGLSNDFEKSAFCLYPELADIKRTLYGMGAAYAQMSGSGSSIFGIFTGDMDADRISHEFVGCRTYVLRGGQMPEGV